MRVFSAALIVGLGLASVTAASAATKEPTLQDKEQAACAKDVERLCPGTIPDAGKAEACMKDKRSQVSAECAKMYDAKK